MAKTVKELRENLAAKQKQLADVFAEAGVDLDMDQVKSLSGTSADKVDWIRQRNEELIVLADEAKTAAILEEARAATDAAGEFVKRPGRSLDFGYGGPGPEDRKSIGERIASSDAVQKKAGSNGPTSEIEFDDLDFKTLMTTSAGWAPESARTGKVQGIATEPVDVLDLIPTVPTSQAAVVYMEETTFTNNAAEVAEGGTYGEGALALTQRTSTVRKVAVFLPVTDEQLEDEGQASAYINNRLPFMLRQRLQTQVIKGNGTPPNLEGIQTRSGIQTYALSAEPVPDAIHKGITLVRATGRAEPDGVGLHPNDWQAIRLLRTADGIYIWGSPSEAGPARIWGLPVSVSTVFTENTGLVGAFREFSELAIRRGIEVQVSNSHGTYFVEGKQAIRADMRVALQVYRPAAFCTVTGI